MKVVAVGEFLWDIVESQEHLGGAPFNVLVHSIRLGNQGILISAVGNEERGKRALKIANQLNVRAEYIKILPSKSTGVAIVKLDSEGVPSFILKRPAAYDYASLSLCELKQINDWAPDWLYFGTLYQCFPDGLQLQLQLMSALKNIRMFYDVNLRPNSYSDDLIRSSLSQANIVKMNLEEVNVICTAIGARYSSLQAFCEECTSRFDLDVICITAGADGCFVFSRNSFMHVPGYKAKVADTVGAGDAFSAAFMHKYHQGCSAFESASFANRLGAVVASKHGPTALWTLDECLNLPLQTAQSTKLFTGETDG